MLHFIVSLSLYHCTHIVGMFFCQHVYHFLYQLQLLNKDCLYALLSNKTAVHRKCYEWKIKVMYIIIRGQFIAISNKEGFYNQKWTDVYSTVKSHMYNRCHNKMLHHLLTLLVQCSTFDVTYEVPAVRTHYTKHKPITIYNIIIQ